MFVLATSPRPRSASSRRLIFLRAADLTIAVLTLESYSLSDISPDAAAELDAAARAHHGDDAGNDVCIHTECRADPVRPRGALPLPAAVARSRTTCAAPARRPASGGAAPGERHSH